MSVPKFVVTGCSRSGTEYAAKLFSAIGLSCHHEEIFSIHWCRSADSLSERLSEFPTRDGDSSFLAVPFLKELPPGTAVLHQIRHPVLVIRSHMGIRFFAEPYEPFMYLADNNPDWVGVIRRYCADIFLSEGELRRCMRYWVMWNRLVEESAQVPGLCYFRYRLEDLDVPLLIQITRLLNHKCDVEVLSNAWATVPRSTNSRVRDETITWQSLPDCEEKHAVGKTARDYGYTVMDV